MRDEDTTVGNDDVLLRAVRDEVLAYGVRRATATSIAQRAGVSRVTVYRRGGGIKALVLDALVTEFQRALLEVGARVEAQGEPRTGRERIVANATELVDTLHDAPLVRALLEHDPDLLLPYVVDRFGRSQQLVLDGLADDIADGQADGSVRDGDPGLLAQVLLQALTPFVIGGRLMTRDHEPAAVRAELCQLVDGFLTSERAGS